MMHTSCPGDQGPNKPFNRSAQRRRRWVPAVLRAAAPG